MRFLIFIFYLASEIYLIAQFIDEWGFLAFVGEVILSAVLGFGILSAQFGAVGDNLKGLMNFQVSIGAFLGKSIFRAIGGILLILPFILSDILGVCFIVISLFFRTNARDSLGDSNFDSKGAFGARFDFEDDFRENFSRDSKCDFYDSTDNGDIIDAEIIEHKEVLK